MSPALEEKLAFTATLTGSYGAAGLVAGKWGCAVDDSVLHALVQRVGSKAETQTQERLQQVPQESQPQRRASELALLMIDGWLARFRGPGWGKKKSEQERVNGTKSRTECFTCMSKPAEPKGAGGVIVDKTVVRSQGDSMDLGRRRHWEAVRGGLGRAKEKLVLGDGMVWIWNLKANRWPDARALLDFWHGGQHLWSLGRAYNGMEEAKAKPWVESDCIGCAMDGGKQF